LKISAIPLSSIEWSEDLFFCSNPVPFKLKIVEITGAE
jgi:hypothetical protein